MVRGAESLKRAPDWSAEILFSHASEFRSVVHVREVHSKEVYGLVSSCTVTLLRTFLRSEMQNVLPVKKNKGKKSIHENRHDHQYGGAIRISPSMI